MKKIILLLAALMVLLTACSSQAVNEIELKDTITVVNDTAKVVRGDIAYKKQIEAYVKAAVENVSFTERGGVLSTVNVMLGDTVKKGDVLASLDTESAESALSAAKDQLSYLEKTYEHNKKQKQIAIDIAKAELEDIKTSGKETDIKIQEIKVEKLQTEMTYFVADSQTAIADQKNKITAQQEILDACYIKAPCDGDVVFVTESTPGSMVQAGKTIISIADPSRMHIELTDTSKLGSYSRVTALILGTEYDVTEVTYSTREYALMAIAGTTPNTTFNFVEMPTDTALVGQLAAIQVYVSERADTLYVPINTVYTGDGKSYVYVMNDDIKEYRAVKTGISNSAYIEILEGLEEGEVVYVKQ